MSPEERRRSNTQAWLDAGFTEDQAELLTTVHNDRRKPWRFEVILVGALSMAIAAGIGILGLVNNGNRISDNENAIAQIHEVRADSLRTSCRDINERHDNALVALGVLSDQAVADDPEREAEIRQGTEQFAVFVEALVPRRNCEDYVTELTNPTQPGNDP